MANQLPSTVIFIGPQGSGKGTQAKVLGEKYNAEYVETGAMLREITTQDSDFGRYVKGLIDHGNLVSDDDIEKILEGKLHLTPLSKAIIFDGIPRRVSQAAFLMRQLRAVGRNEVATIYIPVSREVSVQRLLARRICEKCKTPAIWNGDPNQVCARCGGKLIQRADDQDQERINRRLDQYEADTVPVIDYLKEHTQFFEINGDQPIEKVAEDIRKALNLE